MSPANESKYSRIETMSAHDAWDQLLEMCMREKPSIPYAIALARRVIEHEPRMAPFLKERCHMSSNEWWWLTRHLITAARLLPRIQTIGFPLRPVLWAITIRGNTKWFNYNSENGDARRVSTLRFLRDNQVPLPEDTDLLAHAAIAGRSLPVYQFLIDEMGLPVTDSAWDNTMVMRIWHLPTKLEILGLMLSTGFVPSCPYPFPYCVVDRPTAEFIRDRLGVSVPDDAYLCQIQSGDKSFVTMVRPLDGYL